MTIRGQIYSLTQVDASFISKIRYELNHFFLSVRFCQRQDSCQETVCSRRRHVARPAGRVLVKTICARHVNVNERDTMSIQHNDQAFILML